MPSLSGKVCPKGFDDVHDLEDCLDAKLHMSTFTYYDSSVIVPFKHDWDREIRIGCLSFTPSNEHYPPIKCSSALCAAIAWPYANSRRDLLNYIAETDFFFKDESRQVNTVGLARVRLLPSRFFGVHSIHLLIWVVVMV